MNKTVIINLIGSPGTGKSTMASYIFSKMKMMGLSVELVTEYSKDLVWEERTSTFDDELYIFGKQHHRIFRVNGKVDFIVTDAPLVQKLYYMPQDLPFKDTFQQLVIEANDQYENMNFFLTRKNFSYETTGRTHSEEQSIQIREDMLIIFKEKNIELIMVDENSDTLVNADWIINKALEHKNSLN